jgi:hypothetical protein
MCTRCSTRWDCGPSATRSASSPNRCSC